jgi:hypothetical protein
MTLGAFGHAVRISLSTYLAPADVQFRGSMADGTFDEFSDVDIRASVSIPLDGLFFAGLEGYLTKHFGPALIRYDPDYRNATTIQDIRFSFYDLPIFWRVDLLVESDCDSGRKYPDPFPDWDTGSSALMNVIWALKYSGRGKLDDANHHIAKACEKLGLNRLNYTLKNALILVNELGRRQDVDAILLGKAREIIESETR